jgi:hypothetical protein
MSDDKMPDPSSALGNVGEAAKLIREIGKLLTDIWGQIDAKLRPDYEEAAKGFYKIAVLLRTSTWEIESLLRSFLYMPVDVLERYAIDDKISEIMRGDVSGVVSRIRFRCGDIDTIYKSECRQWRLKILGVKNPLVDEFAEKHKDAEALMTELTQIDAVLITDLSENIVKPLAKFAETVKSAPDDETVVKEYKKLRPFLLENLAVLQDHLSKLDEAVRAFGKLAGVALADQKV